MTTGCYRQLKIAQHLLGPAAYVQRFVYGRDEIHSVGVMESVDGQFVPKPLGTAGTFAEAFDKACLSRHAGPAQ